MGEPKKISEEHALRIMREYPDIQLSDDEIDSDRTVTELEDEALADVLGLLAKKTRGSDHA